MSELNESNNRFLKACLSFFTVLCSIFLVISDVVSCGAELYPLQFRTITYISAAEKHELAAQTSAWIQAERDARRPKALPLDPSEVEYFRPFFPAAILEEARVLAVDEIPAPAFLEELSHNDRKIFHFRRAQGLALDDTVLLRGTHLTPGVPARRSVLFHELVHLVQYETFGVEGFVDRYLASLVEENYSYRRIVFEYQAFKLQSWFNSNPGRQFSVKAEVEALVGKLKTLPPAR